MKKIVQINILLLIFLFNSCGNAQNENQNDNKNNTNNMKNLTEKEWKERLTEEQYHILREKGTERPFTGKYYMHNENGTYKCAGCGAELFTHDMKFESECGWPSFDREIEGGKIIKTPDYSHGMRRVEITCANCGGHLGHIFDDGPTETGQRYCVNSESLTFEPEQTLDTITLAAGCFWCVEAAFDKLDGVVSAVSGYAGGHLKNPTYREVCTGNTGHAEAVQITFNPEKISVEKILEIFFTIHDPTTLNRQGGDVGTQYRSGIFYQNEKQKELAEHIITTLNDQKVFSDPIVTEVTPFTNFYSAENYHQEYYELNKQEPYCQFVVKPKLDKFYKVYKELLKK